MSEFEQWVPLSDVQWMNIVNYDHAWYTYSKEDAVHEAVKMTEAKCRENNAAKQSMQGDIAELQAENEALRKDAERLNFIEKEMYDLRCISLPNADAGDFSEHWEVVSYHMDKPNARTEGHASTARIAIDAAIKGGE